MVKKKLEIAQGKLHQDPASQMLLLSLFCSDEFVPPYEISSLFIPFL